MAQPELWPADRLPAEGVRYGAEEVAAPTQFLATRRKAGRYRIHVNVGFRLSEQQLRDYFSQFGPLTDVYLPKHRSGRVKGFGFCTFESEADLNKALQISDHVVVGVLVRINRAGPRPEFISVSKLERARSSRQASALFSRTATRVSQDPEPQGLPPGAPRRLSLDSNVSSRGRFTDGLLTDQAGTGRDAGGVPGLPGGPRRRSFDTRLLRPGYENTLLRQELQGFAVDARPLRADARPAWHINPDSAGESSLSSTTSEAWRASVDPTQFQTPAGSVNLPPLPFTGTVHAQAQAGFTDSTAAASTHSPWQLNYSSHQAASPHSSVHGDSPLLQQLLQQQLLQQQQQQQQQAQLPSVNLPYTSQGLGDVPALQHAYGGELIGAHHTPLPEAASGVPNLDPDTLGVLAHAMARLSQQDPQPQPQPAEPPLAPSAGSWTPSNNPLAAQPDMQAPGAAPQQDPSSDLLYQLSVQSSWYG